MTLTIQIKGMDMTPAIEQYARDKAETLPQYLDSIVRVDVIVGMESHHHKKGKIYFAEFKVHVPGHDLFVRKDAADLYKAIDKVRDHLKVELEKLKGKMRAKDRDVLRDQKAYHPEDDVL